MFGGSRDKRQKGVNVKYVAWKQQKPRQLEHMRQNKINKSFIFNLFAYVKDISHIEKGIPSDCMVNIINWSHKE